MKAFLKAWKALCAANEGDKGTPRLIIPRKKKFLFQPITFSGPCKSNSVHVEVRNQGKTDETGGIL